MEYLAGLYTLLLVAICLELAVVLWRTGKKQNAAQNNEELKRWMQQQFDAQAKDLAARQAALAEQNYTAIRSVSETLQTAVQNMSSTLAQGQSGQQQKKRRQQPAAGQMDNTHTITSEKPMRRRGRICTGEKIWNDWTKYWPARGAGPAER